MWIIKIFLDVCIFVSLHGQSIYPPKRPSIGVVFPDKTRIGDSCRTVDNRLGKCIAFRNCISAQRHPNNHQNTCYWIDNEPVICCEESKDDEFPHRSNVSQFKCGKRNIREERQITRNSYIAGGELAKPGAWPWMVAILTRNWGCECFLCGGTVISSSYVLTAAHCFEGVGGVASQYIIRVGSTLYWNGTVYTAQDILKHPNYMEIRHYNDIALIKVSSNIQFNRWVQPICLPPPSSLASATLSDINVTLIGWGEQGFEGEIASDLRQVTISVINRNICDMSYTILKDCKLGKGITDQFLCTEMTDDGRVACRGDSGGPLMMYNNGGWTIVGVLSFGYECGRGMYPGVYTKVAYYLDWIKDNLHL